MRPADHPGLRRIFGEAQKIGALGSAPLSEIIEHAATFAEALPVGSHPVLIWVAEQESLAW